MEMILLSSLEARLKNGLEAMLDTVLFRAIFTIGIICESLPCPFAKSRNKVLYSAIVLAAISITFAIYLADEIWHIAKKAKGAVAQVLHSEHKIELSFRTHHFLLLVAAISLVVFAVNNLC